MDKPNCEATIDGAIAETTPEYIYVNVVDIHKDQPFSCHYMLPATEPSCPKFSSANQLDTDGSENQLKDDAHALYSDKSFRPTHLDVVCNADTKIEWAPWKYGVSIGTNFVNDKDAQMVLNDQFTLEHLLILYCGGVMVNKQPDMSSVCRTLTINVTK